MSWTDVAHKVLDIEYRGRGGSTAHQILDAHIKAHIPTQPNLPEIAEKLFKKEGINVKTEAYMLRNLFNGEANCWGLSLMYLVAAENVGLSLDPIRAPGHFFVRFRDINWETTRNENFVFPDERYISVRKIHPKTIENGIYMTPMTEKQIIAQAHANMAADHLAYQEYDLAHKSADKALQQDAKNPDAMAYRGFAALGNEEYLEALASFQSAHNIDPHHYDSWEGRLMVYEKIGPSSLVQPTREMVWDCMLFGTLDKEPTPEEKAAAKKALDDRLEHNK